MNLNVVPGLLLSKALAINTVSSSAFVAKDSSVLFALNIPQADESNDLYFTLAGGSDSAWVVGRQLHFNILDANYSVGCWDGK